MEDFMNHILYGFHLIVGRFDMNKPNIPSLIARKVLNLVMMIYTAAFTIFITKIMEYIEVKNVVLKNEGLFLFVTFVFTTIEDYFLFEKDKKHIKYYQKIVLSKNRSDTKWEVSAVFFSLGAVIIFWLSIEFQ